MSGLCIYFRLNLTLNKKKNVAFSQVKTNSTVVILGNGPNNNVHKLDFPTQIEELVKWATQKFGGVTSLTTVNNLMRLSTTGTAGKNYFHRL